jgi:hypothetical protein
MVIANQPVRSAHNQPSANSYRVLRVIPAAAAKTKQKRVLPLELSLQPEHSVAALTRRRPVDIIEDPEQLREVYGAAH